MPSVQFVTTPSGKTIRVVRELVGTKTVERRFAEVLVSVIDDNGNGRMARALLDSGCSKSILLKKFTSKKSRSALSAKDRTVYQTYGGEFVSKSTASVAF